MAENQYLSPQSTDFLKLNIDDVIEVIQEQSDPEMSSLYDGGPSEPTYTALPSTSSHYEAEDPKKNAYVKITEQPQQKALRFRYMCEGRSAGSIPGISSTADNKTYPSIKVCNYKGPAFVVVSCVTVEAPYRPHPHNLVGKSCKDGICTMKITNDSMECMFSNLGIQCVKKKDVEKALKSREDQRVDPFRTGFAHHAQSQNIDLNAVRLCFQVFLEGKDKGKFTYPLPPVVSNSIYDKKATSDLVICKLSDCTSPVYGGKEIILLCDKVTKDDIQIRFFEIKDDVVTWESLGEFQASDVHKQVAISFKTPKYLHTEIENDVQVYIQLKRPSDNSVSEPLPFQYVPMDTGDLKRKWRKIAKVNNAEMFGLYISDISRRPESHMDPSTGAIPRTIFHSPRPTHLTEQVKIEPQDIGLSPSPEMTGGVIGKISIPPQHTAGGFVCQNPGTSPSNLPTFLATSPHTFYPPEISPGPLLSPMHDDATAANDVQGSAIPFYNENSPGPSLNLRDPLVRIAPHMVPLEAHKQPSPVENNDDEFGNIKSAELLFRGDPTASQIQPNDAFIASFSNSLTFDENTQGSNQLNMVNDVNPESRSSVAFCPNIPTNSTSHMVSETNSIPSSDSVHRLKMDLETFNSLVNENC